MLMGHNSYSSSRNTWQMCCHGKGISSGANMLIGIDIIAPEKFNIDLGKATITLPFCDNMQVPLTVTSANRISTSILSKEQVTIQPKSRQLVTVTGKKSKLTLPAGRDFLFEPKRQPKLTMYTHIVDCNISQVIVQNDGSTPIVLLKNTKLGEVHDHDIVEAYKVEPSDNWSTVAVEAASKKPQESEPDDKARKSFRELLTSESNRNVVCKPHLEQKLSNHVTVYGEKDSISELANVVPAYPELWKDTGNVNIPESQYMEIPLKDNWREMFKPGQAKIYPVSHRDREVIDETFDNLHDQGRMEWTQGCAPFSFPCFVVWKIVNGKAKGRVVIDIRALNKISEIDAFLTSHPGKITLPPMLQFQ